MRFERCSLLITIAATLSTANAPPIETVAGVAGLRERIEIVRDRESVPHIRAANEADAIFGLGFVHAQDRLWQLKFLRRVGSGRLSEALGPPGLESDKLFRPLGLARAIRRVLQPVLRRPHRRVAAGGLSPDGLRGSGGRPAGNGEDLTPALIGGRPSAR